MPLGPTRDLGPCEVWYNSAKVGPFFGTVSFRFSQEDADVFESDFGNTPVDSVFIGSGPCEVTVPFTRLTLANLAVVLPGGSYGTAGPVVQLIADQKIGESEYDNAKELILKPIIAGEVTDTAQWLHVPKAYPRADYDFSFDMSGQRVYNTIFKGFPDASTKGTWYIGVL